MGHGAMGDEHPAITTGARYHLKSRGCIPSGRVIQWSTPKIHWLIVIAIVHRNEHCRAMGGAPHAPLDKTMLYELRICKPPVH